MTQTINKQIELAYDYVQYTNKNIFLTGKAGTGKTTFLKRIQAESIKRTVVLAPTGVAAINAGGMTIHSFFQLPFGLFLPNGRSEAEKQRKFSRKKIDLIKSLDLLIIDEISMVRADLLDAIDDVLRRLRRSKLPFAGVQLLMIGDLHQLPPVVRPDDWNLLREHYSTPYFFGSLALKETQPISIKLTHIYRQSDSVFIDLLNKVRNNQLDQAVLEQINSRYIPNFVAPEDKAYIILTSHNRAAQNINQEKLEEIDRPVWKYEAEIDGNFAEKNYPTEEVLELKKGAQVMFVKNDLSYKKRYYNGKIGQITGLEKDRIYVQCPDDEEEIQVAIEEWTNVKYSLDPESKEVKEDIVGVFRQFPLKLAWAITIHKSQGLTFERAIIDAQAAFAHGQVYVALSRCKSFEGVVLRTKIAYSSVKTDQAVK
ncbi:MAG: PIF1 family DEAD/DEAH box helicase, partial [Bacteroidota bacterium]